MTVSSDRPHSRHHRIRMVLVALIGLAAVSHGVIFIRLAGDVPALLLAAARVAIATLVFLPFALNGLRKPSHALRPSGRVLIGVSVLSGLFLALHFASWIESVQRLTIAESALLVSLSPIWIAVAGVALGHGRPPNGVLIGTVLCLVGLILIGWDGLRNPQVDPVGLALATLGGMALAGYLMIGKHIRQYLETSQYVTLCYGSAAATLVLAGLVMDIHVTGLGIQAWLAILALGLVSQVIGHTSYNHALGRVSPIFVAICLLGEPIIGSILGLVYFREAVPDMTIIGAVPILVGLWYAIRAEMGQ
ncbi:MAG: DMT family transporter [Alphaproteobacteria bacterium]|nr:DMT family transporter [Alphaproteobacteria bacterium]